MPHAPWLRAAAIVATLTPLVVPGAVLAQPAKPAAAAPDDATTKKATSFFLKGSEFFNAKRHALALEQFTKSYQTVASPNSHLYIARCLVALNEHLSAYREYNKIIAEVDARGPNDEKYAPTRDQAKIERDELAPKVALVTITPPGAKLDLAVKLAGELIPTDDWKRPIAVKPGLVPVEIQLEGKPASAQSITISLGEKRAIVLDQNSAVQAATARLNGSNKPKVASSGSVLRPLAYAAGGVGVVGMVMFAVAGSMSKATYSSLETKCNKGPCPSELAGDVSKGKTQQTIANVGLGVGLVGLAAGTTMYLLSSGSGKKKKGDDETMKTGAHVEVGPGYLGVAGQF